MIIHCVFVSRPAPTLAPKKVKEIPTMTIIYENERGTLRPSNRETERTVGFYGLQIGSAATLGTTLLTTYPRQLAARPRECMYDCT